jgi:transcriptional regulator with XRE-family HTH domain
MSRFQQVNTQVLRELRLKRGWSQKELAEKAGYSDRLVRKAEFGGKLDVDTIRNIAEALSTLNEKITLDFLTNDVLSVAKTFMQFFDERGAGMLPAINHYIAPDFVLHVTSAIESLPLDGTWEGKQGLCEFLNLFFETFSRAPNSLAPRYAVGTDFIVASYTDTLQAPNRPDEMIQVYRHFHFRDGQLSRIDDLYESPVVSG